MDHVRTQLPYAAVVGLTSISLGYLPAALGYSGVLNYIFAFVFFGLLLFLFGKKSVTESDLVPAGSVDPIKDGMTGASA